MVSLTIPSIPRPLAFVKLGGSVIAPKVGGRTLMTQTIQALAEAMAKGPSSLVIGHGGGSYGHFPAKEYSVRGGVHPQHGWLGWHRTACEMAELRQAVTGILIASGLPVVPLVPYCLGLANDGSLQTLDPTLIRETLHQGCIPLVHGDVFLDRTRGFTVISTEEIFLHLARALAPDLVVLVADTPGVMLGFDTPEAQMVTRVTPATLPGLEAHLTGSKGKDVTGGMLAKVRHLAQLMETASGNTRGWIVGAQDPTCLAKALQGGSPPGTEFIWNQQ